MGIGILPEGQIELRGDTASVITNAMPGGITLFSNWNAGNRVRGNFFRCDTPTELSRQGFYLGRSQATAVQFVVYESSTENGTYTLKASNAVSASIGTNYVYSTGLNAVLEEEKYYMIGSVWDTTCLYQTAGAHSRPVYFGASLNGFEQNTTYPANPSITKSSSSFVYVQTLEVSTNMVMRMDDNLNGGLYSTNSLGLVSDLEGYDPLTLSFKHRAAGEEAQPEEGIFLSIDGGTVFHKIYDLPSGTTGWQTFNLDLNALGGGQVQLSIQWPIAYTEPFVFSAMYSDDLTASGFTNDHELEFGSLNTTINIDSSEARFYKVGIRLR